MTNASTQLIRAGSAREGIPIICRLGTVLVDVRRFWIFPVILALVFVLNVMVVGSLPNRASWAVTVVGIYHALVGLIAVLSGLACASDDRERGTLWLLRSLPVSPLKLVLQKLLSCLLLVSLFIALAESVVWIWKETHVVEEFLLFPTLGSFSHPTPWNYGGWFPLSFVQTCALILVGLTSGTIFRNFVIAAVFGLSFYVAWQFLWHGALSQLELAPNLRPYYLASTVHFTLLCGLAIFEYARAVRYMPASSYGVQLRISQKQGSKLHSLLEPVRNLRLPWERVVSPHSTGVTVAALVIAAISLLLQLLSYPALNAGNSGYHLTILTLLSVPVIGACAFTREEFSALESYIFSQPVNRINLLLERLVTVTAWTLVAMTPAALGTFQFPSGHFLIPVIALAVAGAYLGVLGRLFYRNPVFPLVLAMTTVFAWAWCFMAMFGFDSQAGSSTYLVDSGYLTWYTLIVTLLPLIALLVSFVFSDVLISSEGGRAGAGISVYISILLLGMLLLTAMPGELWRLIFLSTRHLFQLSWGGEL